MDYEEMILERQESLADDCHACECNPRNGGTCHCQCEEIHETYNPALAGYLERRNK